MKLKKVAALFLCIAMLGSVSAFAADTTNADVSDLPAVGEIGREFPESETYEIAQIDPEFLSASNLDEIAEISREKYEATGQNYTDEELQSTLKIMKKYEEALEGSSAKATTSYEVTNSAVLAYFCYDDGLSVSDLAVADVCSETAREESLNYVEGYEDSCRHFTWNHLMTTELSKTKARNVGCNYEFAGVILPYAESAYDDYIADGDTVSVAYYKALNYALQLREDFLSICDYSVDYFSMVFNDAAVRDFWNNCYGRAYADSYSYTYSVAFLVAISNDELINDDDDVTQSHIDSVWSWDWYTP